jgi:uncharacterized HAD superfamily protein
MSENQINLKKNKFDSITSILPTEIGFDIDGVVADTMKAFIRIAQEEFGINYISKEQVTSYWIEECLPIPLDIINTIINHLLIDPCGFGLEPIPGAREVLIKLAPYGQLTFVTARPVKKPIENWLVSLLSDIPAKDIRVIATGHHLAKVKVLKELGLRYFIDDHLETCQDLHCKGIRTMIFDQPWNKGATPFLRIKSWEALSSIIAI